ncbi:hypothetical protein BUE93_21640 [Chromobacterium amazonense]|uniref:TraD protein n=1 Tax=Chromobacterium amazonense TaxID=1382803 RepID=A0A2S9WYU2_9NEIS|nr:hypothetical protein [Chromobacterium amazonense]PRP68566.1 hypothetical protein BUE93_21640 [Chromobacterium amazonense]
MESRKTTQQAIARLNALEPTTTAARLRPLLPVIQERLDAGVRYADILKALAEEGLDVQLRVLQNALYAYKKSRQPAPPVEAPTMKEAVAAPQPTPSGMGTDTPASKSKPNESPNIAIDSPPRKSASPLTDAEFAAALHPDPKENAAKMTEYEKIGKQLAMQRRIKK